MSAVPEEGVMGWFKMKWHGVLLVEASAGYVMTYVTLFCMPFIIVGITFKKIGLITHEMNMFEK
jgi:hypothetical protein